MIKVKSEELRKSIYSKGLSLSKFAELCGKSHGSLTVILDRGSISAEYAKKICEVLNEDFSKFFDACSRKDSAYRNLQNLTKRRKKDERK